MNWLPYFSVERNLKCILLIAMSYILIGTAQEIFEIKSHTIHENRITTENEEHAQISVEALTEDKQNFGVTTREEDIVIETTTTSSGSLNNRAEETTRFDQTTPDESSSTFSIPTGDNPPTRDAHEEERRHLPKKPHIIFILADDLGWNDVGFHGSNQIPTPNIDALAYAGVQLNNYYVQPVCTPSRTALLTGKYPMRLGMQHSVLFGSEPRGLPLSEKLLPEYLRDLGYTNRIVGKWHLGSWKKDYLPTNRGFESHVGFWTGHHDQNDHTAMETGMWGLDMREGLDVAYRLHGKHTTDIVTEESIKIIGSHPQDEPLFLYVSHAAVHSGNPYNPICARDEDVELFGNITDYKRRRFAGLLHRLDQSVGQVVEALSNRGMLQNSVIVFSTDNGGAASGFNLNAASNWPLRGEKNTPWEGGVRGAAFIWSPLIEKKSRIHNDLFHIVDWLPTLVRIANVTDPANNNSCTKDIPDVDGIDSWESLTNGLKSRRNEILLNIDDIAKVASLRVGDWKLVDGTTYQGSWDSWYGPSGRDNTFYNIEAVQTSKAATALLSLGQTLPTDLITNLREAVEINCSIPEVENECHPLLSACLFNIRDDPCEYQNLAMKYPDILEHLRIRLSKYNETAVPAANLSIDRRGDPKYWNYVWTNWGDYVQ